ncbi:MAG: hypothetical protein JNL11_11255 [Bdellovibrionaceae bacterium]|nr:hypothetical protein [Pseudobdellovibrionaceae bacterium]
MIVNRKFQLLLYIVHVIAAFTVGCGKSEFDPLLKTIPSLKPENNGPSLKTSSMDISSPNVADGINPAIVTLHLKTEDDKPVTGLQMGLQVSGSGNIIVPCTPSDNLGQSECQIYSFKAEIKKVSTVGTITMKEETIFQRPPVSKSTFGIVSSGHFETHSSGINIVSMSGITESDTRLYDSSGALRVKTSIFNSIIEKK